MVEAGQHYVEMSGAGTKHQYFSLDALGMPEDWFEGETEHERENRLFGRTGSEEVVVESQTVVVDTPVKAVMEVADFKSKEYEREEGLTIVFSGGGFSPGTGQNIKTIMELLRALGIQTDEDQRKMANEDQKVKIARVVILPNAEGIPRESYGKVGSSKEDLRERIKENGQIMANALEQLEVKGHLILIGHSAGGAQSVAIATELEKRDDHRVGQVDLVLLEPVGLNDVGESDEVNSLLPLITSIYNFSLGTLISGYRKNRKMFGFWESLQKSTEEQGVGWVTTEGRIKDIGMWAREILRPNRSESLAKLHGMKPARPRLGFRAYLNNLFEDYKDIRGRVLVIEMRNAGVAPNPATAMIKNKRFPNAKEMRAYAVLGGTHGSIMVDSKLNTSLAACYELNQTEEGLVEEFRRLGNGVGRMSRIFGAGGEYIPIAWLVAEWMREELEN